MSFNIGPPPNGPQSSNIPRGPPDYNNTGNAGNTPGVPNRRHSMSQPFNATQIPDGVKRLTQAQMSKLKPRGPPPSSPHIMVNTPPAMHAPSLGRPGSGNSAVKRGPPPRGPPPQGPAPHGPIPQGPPPRSISPLSFGRANTPLSGQRKRLEQSPHFQGNSENVLYFTFNIHLFLFITKVGVFNKSRSTNTIRLE